MTKNNENNDLMKKKNEEFQTFHRDNLSNVNYIEAQQIFSELSQGKFRDAEHLLDLQRSKGKVKLCKIKNCEYGDNNQETQTTLSTNVCCDKNGVIHMNADSDVPDFIVSASLPIDEAVNMIYHWIG